MRETIPSPSKTIAISITGANTHPQARRLTSSTPAGPAAGRNTARSGTCTGFVGNPASASASGTVPASIDGTISESHSNENTATIPSSSTEAEPVCACAQRLAAQGWLRELLARSCLAARNSCRGAAMKKQPNASVPNGNGWPPSRRIAPASPMRRHSRGGAPWRRAARARAPTAAIQPSDPTMLRANGGPNAGQSWTTSKTPSCCTAERSRALRIASPRRRSSQIPGRGRARATTPRPSRPPTHAGRQTQWRRHRDADGTRASSRAACRRPQDQP